MNTAPNENITSPNADNTPKNQKIAREIYDWVEIFVVTISLILLIFTFVGRIAYVDGPSMEKTLFDGETLIVSNLFYTPERGDIIVFQAPDSHVDGGIVKRVIATEGQVVDIDFDNWAVYVDGVRLDETGYVNFLPGYGMRQYDVTFPVTVPEGHIFVMGDNRNHSNDSRDSDIGFVDTRFVFGRVMFRVTPFNKIGPIK